MDYHNSIEERYLVNYPNIEASILKLVPFLNNYNIQDVAKGIFTISAWIDNRSAIGIILALNAAIRRTDGSGSARITDYVSFSRFFDKVKELVSLDPLEDCQCKDFGHVKVRFRYKYYSAIIGTGLDFSFQALQFLSALVEEMECEDDVYVVLDYWQTIIDFLASSNQSTNSSNDICFEQPPLKFFAVVSELIESDQFIYSTQGAYDVLKRIDINMAKQYFIKSKKWLLPLFDTCLLHDCYSSLLAHADEHQIKRHINLALAKQVHDIYYTHCKTANAAMIDLIICREHTPAIEIGFAFALMSKKAIILSFQVDGDKPQELESIQRLVNGLQRDSKLTFIEKLRGEKGYRALSIPTDTKIILMPYDDYTNITQRNLVLRGENEQPTYLPLDIIALLCFSDGIEEIIEFLEFLKENKSQILSYSGYFEIFTAWKESKKQFEKGAIHYGSIMLDPNSATCYVSDYYKNELEGFPFLHINHLFNDPFAWRIEISDNHRAFISKSNSSFGGFTYTLANCCYLFASHNFDMWNLNDANSQAFENIKLLDELIDRLVIEFQSLLSRNDYVRGKVMQLLFIPIEYAKQHMDYQEMLNEKRTIVYSDLHCDDAVIQIRYTLDLDDLLSQVSEATNRVIECRFMCELFKPLFGLAYGDDECWVKEIHSRENEKRTVAAFQYAPKYAFPTALVKYEHETMFLQRVKKRIAEICLDSKIEPGVYTGISAKDIVRKMQYVMMEDFEENFKPTNQLDLHIRLLSRYATVVHQINIDQQRYHSFDNLREDVAAEFLTKTEEERESKKHYRDELLYCIETNLFLQRNKDLPWCSEDELSYLVAYANWITTLLTSSDVCFHDLGNETINVLHDYQVENEQSDTEKARILDYRRRRYSYQEYEIHYDSTDHEYIHKANNAFMMDTGLEFELTFKLLTILSMPFSDRDDNSLAEQKPGVYSIDLDDLLRECVECENLKITKEVMIRIIEFFSIDPSKLKYLKDIDQGILPTWERRNRDNRFDIKPLVQNDGKLIWAPTVAYEVQQRWLMGIQNQYLPYEIGMNHLMTVLDDWRERYQTLMVMDLEKLLIAEGFNYVRREAELHNLDTEGEHPLELGDYDLIGVRHATKQIVIVEAKHIHKVGSIAEHVFQQKGFFLQNKYDEKFQRRIDYFKAEYPAIFTRISIPFDETYVFEAYMVTNKVFSSWIKEIKFPIVSFAEFEEIIKAKKES